MRAPSLYAALALTALCAGCPDTHGRPDATVPPDAWGDVGPVDAFAPPRCTVEGWPVAAVTGSSAILATCACPEGTIPGIGLSSPAPLAVQHGPFALCIPPRSAARWIVSLCAAGQVVHRYQGRRSEDLGVNFTDELTFGDGCMDARACLFAEQQLPASMRPGCVYSDYTLAVNGLVPPVGDCESLAAGGLCSIDCPCPSGPLPDCFGLSETHPVGACATTLFCSAMSTVGCMPGQNCMRTSSVPEWGEDIESAVPAGRCVDPAACTALVARTEGLWSCEPAR